MGIVLIGKQMVSFPDQKTGQLVEGVKLHMTAPSDNVSGLSAVTQFIRKGHVVYDAAVALPLGDIEIDYGFRGSILAIRSIKK